MSYYYNAVNGVMIMDYEQLLDEAYNNNVIVKELNLKSSSGRCYGNRIAINKDIETTVEKTCILAEELGHYYYSVGDILNQSDVSNRKQEYKARLNAYDKLIGLKGIINAYLHGCKNKYEIADYLNITEEFLCDAIACYKNKYGIFYKSGDYIIYFEPNLGVLKQI